MKGTTNGHMARTRALMTDTDRRYIAGEADVDENKRYQAISRVRDRFDELEKDVEVLEEHHPGLLDELREVVCEDGGDDVNE
jgi:predicted nuclease with TOPRIM domain